VFKNKVLRKIGVFRLQEGESTKTLERENCVLRRLMDRACGLNRGELSAYRVWMGKPEGKTTWKTFG
jgi:hypothetical protein